jgi:hypothetical protein
MLLYDFSNVLERDYTSQIFTSILMVYITIQASDRTVRSPRLVPCNVYEPVTVELLEILIRPVKILLQTLSYIKLSL